MKKMIFTIAAVLMTLTAVAESITLNGNIALDGKIRPELQANGNKYLLLLPRVLEFQMKENAKAEVVLETSNWNERGFIAVDENDEKYLIKKLVIDGQEFNVTSFTDGRGPMMRDDCPVLDGDYDAAGQRYGRNQRSGGRGQKGNSGRGGGQPMYNNQRR